ncbi:MAG TPA: multiheme c-type cytochrome [Actinomycetota bacterium]|nr:multiheme c-type cytochrome [Actinomycetota bacterium]
MAGIIVGGVFALGTSMLRSAHEAGGNSDDAFFAIVLVGVIAVTLMAVVGFYSARKRRRGLQEHLPGTMMTWLKGHVWLGLAALFAVLVHAWLYPITFEISTGKITLAILLVLVLSGIAWRIVYETVPKRVAERVGNLSIKDTRSRLEQTQVEIEKATAGGSDELRNLVALLLAGKTRVPELDHRALMLPIEEQGTWEELKRLAERRERYGDRGPKQERYHRLLQRWKVVHLPLAVILGAALAIHIGDVLGLKQKVAASETDAFPDSSACAGCHTDIVEEWRLAMHAIAQTNPTVVAQTALALERYPEFGQVCTNCHSPIGTQVAPGATYPLPGQEGGGQILSDGVTCWTCHALPEQPAEISGAAADFPVNRAGTRSFGFVFAPPVEGDFPLPVPDHQVDVGFMMDEIETYQLCGACHNVKVDLGGDGFSVLGDDVSEGSREDQDGDGQLNENELQFVDDNGNGIADLEPGSVELDVDGTDRLLDLVLQTTFDEWEDFRESDQFRGETCGTCHLPSLGQGPTVDRAPGGLALPDRPLHSHEFVGVDYSLEPGHYTALGVGGEDATSHVLSARDALIAQAAGIAPEVIRVNANQLLMEVTVRSGFVGHDFPTGFAFARQWWLEVSAETVSGDPVCLLPVNPGTGQVDPTNGIASPCSSGTVETPQTDLRTCDPRQVAAEFGDELRARGIEPRNATTVLTAPAPLSDCDPWLTNFQKILTDGDPEGTGQFVEVAYQSLLPDIVKLQTRVADQQPMRTLKAYDDPTTEVDDRELTFGYAFDTRAVRGQDVVVTVRFHLRHLPPYFLRALDGFYPGGLTSDALLPQMVISTFAVAETEPARVPVA